MQIKLINLNFTWNLFFCLFIFESLRCTFKNTLWFRNFYNFNVFICRWNYYFFVSCISWNLIWSWTRNHFNIFFNFFSSWLTGVKWNNCFNCHKISAYFILTWPNSISCCSLNISCFFLRNINECHYYTVIVISVYQIKINCYFFS